MTTTSEPSAGRSLAYLFGIPIDRVKGIGPRKLEQYASEVLDIIASHREKSSQEET